MIDKFDRDGKPISLKQWGELMNNPDYQRVVQTTLADGKWISTVWVGLNYNWGDNAKPLIFETMVFPKHGDYREIDCERYSTLEEAKKGHELMVKKYALQN